MPKQSPTYDLTLLLSTSAEEDRRAKILADVESAIADGGGTLEHKDAWGTRTLSYRIDHQADAEYQLLQFSGPAELLESLSHSLRITDGVLRFRIIKARPGTPRQDSGRPARAAAADPERAEDDRSAQDAAAATADAGAGS